MKPQVIAHELGKRLRSDAIVTPDSGTITSWFARQIPAQRGQMYSCSGTLATMARPSLRQRGADGLPRPPGRGLRRRRRLHHADEEFVTAVKYKLPIKVVIIKNNTLGQIKWEQMVFLGNPEYGVELQPIDFVKFAEACGATGIRIDDLPNNAALCLIAPWLQQAAVLY